MKHFISEFPSSPAATLANEQTRFRLNAFLGAVRRIYTGGLSAPASNVSHRKRGEGRDDAFGYASH